MTAGDALAAVGSGLMANAQNTRSAWNNAQNAAAAYQNSLGNLGLNGLQSAFGAAYSQQAKQALNAYAIEKGPQFAAMVLKDIEEVAHQKRLAGIEAEISRLREANDHRQHELVELWFGASPAS